MKVISYSDEVQAWEYHEFGIIMQILLCVFLSLLIGLFFLNGTLPNVERVISDPGNRLLVEDCGWACLSFVAVTGYFIGKASGRRYFLHREKLLTH